MASAELRSLYGVRGGNRVTLCMSAGAAGRGRDVCAGALWRRHWVLVHASCVAHRALYPVVLVRDHADDVDCEEVQQDLLYYNYRKVLARFLHPDYPEMDFALICVLDPFDALQVTSNVSLSLLAKGTIYTDQCPLCCLQHCRFYSASRSATRVPIDGEYTRLIIHPEGPPTGSKLSVPTLKDVALEPWLLDTYNGFSPETHLADYTPSEENMMFATPVRMFIVSVVLPLSFFIAFFLLVTFYTGTDKSSHSYRSLNEKEDSALA